MTERQLRALTRGHLCMLIRDLEKDLQREKLEKDRMLLAYQAGFAQNQQSAGLAAEPKPSVAEPIVPPPVVIRPPVVIQPPAYTEPAVRQPVYTEPAARQPVYTEPAVRQPVYTEPAVRQPVYTESAVRQPVYTEPAIRQPVYTKPVEQPQERYSPPPAPPQAASYNNAGRQPSELSFDELLTQLKDSLLKYKALY